MPHIVDRTVTTPDWHGTANVVALIVTITILSAMAISAALMTSSMVAVSIAAGAGIAGVIGAVMSTPRSLAHVNAR